MPQMRVKWNLQPAVIARHEDIQFTEKEKITLLALETIMNALYDIRDRNKPSDNRGAGNRQQNFRNAMAWFKRRDQEVFGYGWCLVMTGANPNDCRRLINEILWTTRKSK